MNGTVSWFAEHWFATALIAAYAAMLVVHARSGLRGTRGTADYFIGGRRFGGLAIGVSFYATFASTNSYLGHAGQGYEYGLPWLSMAVLLVLFGWLSWRFVAPRLRRFVADWGSVTVPDFLAVRFASDRVRRAAAAIIVFSSLLYLIAIFKGVGHIFQAFLGIPYEAAVALNLVIVMAYTSVGGFLSVVRTDVLQGVLMVIGSLLLFAFVTHAAGGVGVIGRVTEVEGAEHLFDMDAGIPFPVLIGIALAGSFKLLIDPRQVTRYYGLRDEQSLRTGMWVAVAGILVVQFSLFPIGLYARFLVEGITDTDVLIPMLVNDTTVFPRLVGDFLVVAMLGAAMSSIDSVLLVAASVTTRDVLPPTSEAREVRRTRIGVVAFALVAALVALRPPGGIIDITIFSGSLYAVCFLPTVLLGLHWRRGNETAALAAFAVGIAVLLGWLALGLKAVLHEVFPALAASMAVYTFLAARGKLVDDPRVQRYFAREATPAALGS